MEKVIVAPLLVHAEARTDVGRKRSNNEDSHIADSLHGLFAVADGMGGHAGGEIASQMAISGLLAAMANMPDADYLREPSVTARQAVFSWLTSTIEEINEAIHERAQREPQLHGMGCTLDVVIVRGRGAFLAHVGDSRIYAYRKQVFQQLTEDHNLGQMLLKNKVLSREQVANHPQRNTLSRALGPFAQTQVDTLYMDLSPGDRLLLCSDGLHGEVDDVTLSSMMEGSLSERAEDMIQAALAGGGKDNITVVLLDVEGLPLTTSAMQPILGNPDSQAALSRCRLFSGLSKGEQVQIQKLATGESLSAGYPVIRQGEPADTFYVLVAGKAGMYRDGRRVATYLAGDSFGDVALLDNLRYAITVETEEPSQLLSFRAEDLKRLLHLEPAIWGKISAPLLQRISNYIRILEERVDKLGNELSFLD